MQAGDYKDLDKTPEPVAKATGMLARNIAHLARLLGMAGYPGVVQKRDLDAWTASVRARSKRGGFTGFSTRGASASAGFWSSGPI